MAITTTVTVTKPAATAVKEGYAPNPGPGFQSAVVSFPDGSVWRVTGALSDRAYQACNAPCEARQVFTCACVKDPTGKYKVINEAVMKVKYQVRADEDEIRMIKGTMEEVEESLKNDPEGYKETYAENMEALDTRLCLSTQPTNRPSEATRREYYALKHLAKTNCSSTPHLLSFARDHLTEGIDDEKAILGGYVVFMLMTKVPGKRLSYWGFRELELSERDNIREAFKQAFMDVISHNVFPLDRAPRNIIWDKDRQKCYIVDFEDYVRVTCDGGNVEWDDQQFEYWHLKDYPKGEEPLDYYWS